MSQFPLEGGGPYAPQQLRRTPNISELRQSVSPGDVNLITRPDTFDRGAQMAAQLDRVLDGAAHIAGQVGTMSEKERRDEAILAETEDRVHRAYAAQRFHEEFPSIASDFANNKIPVAIDDPTPLVKSIVAAHTQEMHPAAVAEWGRLAADQITPLAVAQRDKQIDAFRTDTRNMMEYRAVSMKDAASIQQLVTEYREMNPNATEAEASLIPLKALQTAAHTGEPEKFAAAKEVLGTRFADQQATAQLLLTDSLRRKQLAVDQSFEDDVANQYGKPGEIIRERIQSWQGKASPERIRAELRTIDTEERTARARAYEQAKVLDLDTKKSDLVSGALELMRSAASTGGASQIPSQVQIMDLDGRPHDVSRSDIVQPAISAEMFRLSKLPAEQALPAQTRFLADNGETFDGWKRTMEAGPLVNTIDIDSATPKDIPANLGRGYALYKSIGAINPRLRDQHLSSASSSRFYELAELAEKYVTPGDPNAALLMATRAAKREPFGDNTAMKVRSDLITAEVDRRASSGYLWWSKNVRNANEVGAEVARVADLYVHTLGVSPQVAVDEASRRIDHGWTTINEWAVPTRGRNVPSVLPAAAKVIADEYAKAHGKAEGVEAGDLVLQPADVPGLWILWNKSTLSPVQHWADEGRFTDSDFGKLLSDIQAAKEDAAARRVSHGMNLPGSFKNNRDTFNEAVRSAITGDPLLANPTRAP